MAGVPRDLEAICLRCLEKKPSARYETAASLAADLQRYLNGEPVRARRISRAERGLRWRRRNPAIAGGLTIAFLGLTFGLIAATWQWQQVKEGLANEKEQRIRAERNVHRFENLIDETLNKTAKNLRFVPQMESVRKEMLDQVLKLQQELIADESDNPRVKLETSRAYHRIADLLHQLGRFDEGHDAANTALRLLRRIDASNVEKPRIRYEEARIQYLIRSGCECLHLKPASRDFSGKSLLAAVGLRARIGFGTSSSRIHDSQRNLPEAELAIRKSIDVADLLNSSTDEELMMLKADMQFHLGVVSQEQRKHDAAIVAFQGCIARLAKLSQQIQLRVECGKQLAQSLNSLAIAHKEIGELKLAADEYRQAIEIAEELHEQRPERIDLAEMVATSSYNLGNLLYAQHEYAGAVESYQRAFESLRHLDSTFPRTIRYQHVLGLAASGLGRRTIDLSQGRAFGILGDKIRPYPSWFPSLPRRG